MKLTRFPQRPLPVLPTSCSWLASALWALRRGSLRVSPCPGLALRLRAAHCDTAPRRAGLLVGNDPRRGTARHRARAFGDRHGEGGSLRPGPAPVGHRARP